MSSHTLFQLLFFICVISARCIAETSLNENAFGMEAIRLVDSLKYKSVNLTKEELDSLKNKTLRAAYMLEPPFVTNLTQEDTERTIRHDSGVVIEILKMVAEKYQLKYEFVLEEDSVWGKPNRTNNGTIWTGLIGKLQRQEVDLVAGAMILEEARTEVLDFTYPFMSTQTRALIRSPDVFTDNQFLIIKAPFNRDVWATTAASVFASALIAMLLCRITRKFLSEEANFSFMDLVWAFYAIFVQQDIRTLPRTWTVRTLFAFWMLAGMTLAAAFTGNMMAMFAVAKSGIPFKSVEELVRKMKSANFKVILQNTTNARVSLIQHSSTAAIKDLWYEMIMHHKWINVSSLQEGIEMVVNEPNMVLLASKDPLDEIVASNCNVTTVDLEEPLLPVWLSIAFRKNSPYVALFSEAIESFNAAGLVDKWLSRYQTVHDYYHGVACDSTNVGEIDMQQSAIAMDKAQGAFWLLLFGACFGIAGLVLEKAFNRAARTKASKALTKTAVGAASDARRLSAAAVDALHAAIAGNSAVVPVVDIAESPRSYRPTVSKFGRGAVGQCSVTTIAVLPPNSVPAEQMAGEYMDGDQRLGSSLGVGYVLKQRNRKGDKAT